MMNEAVLILIAILIVNQIFNQRREFDPRNEIAFHHIEIRDQNCLQNKPMNHYQHILI